MRFIIKISSASGICTALPKLLGHLPPPFYSPPLPSFFLAKKNYRTARYIFSREKKRARGGNKRGGGPNVPATSVNCATVDLLDRRFGAKKLYVSHQSMSGFDSTQLIKHENLTFWRFIEKSIESLVARYHTAKSKG